MLTITQAAEHFTAHFGTDIPVWKLRRVVDSLDLPIARVGLYRIISRDQLVPIADALKPWVESRREAIRAEVAS